ncbi:MAG: hypothetical protein Hyperionvirus19_11 [Hyperionvirus sp.]|uniref:Uncharacterized protein n=1 Tax=Hyperionvirus sp. TaxID=2487770 RepID=A0A3G5AAB8_9VIRU|nr:MAG: hypothetical protein Hyperionvirus19_11 [Hyperionvirus sp.]
MNIFFEIIYIEIIYEGHIFMGGGFASVGGFFVVVSW